MDIINFYYASKNDVQLVYNWANHPSVRANSYNNEPIMYQNHVSWFYKKIDFEEAIFYIFKNSAEQNIGFVRIDKSEINKPVTFSIVIGEEHRGKRYATSMIKMASSDYLQKNPNRIIQAFVLKTNEPSYKAFVQAKFIPQSEQNINGILSYVLIAKTE